MLYKQFKKSVAEHQIFQADQKVVVACSGGADSLCLLHLTQRFAKQEGLTIIVCHVNHKLRELESERDAQMVYNYCLANNLLFELQEVDVKGLTEQSNLSIETAARQLRYAALRAIKSKYGAGVILTAHTKNDQVETFFLNMLRGASLSGLKGIVPKDKDLGRPLLDIAREEIEAYCQQQNLTYCQDSSNEELLYLRNSVRKELIPYIKEKYNPQIIEVIARNMKVLQREDEYLQKAVIPFLDKITCADGKIFLLKRDLQNLPKAVFLRLILQAVAKLTGSKQGITYIHLEEVFNLIQGGKTGKIIQLPGKVEAVLEYSNLVIQFAQTKAEKKGLIENVELKSPGVYKCGYGTFTVQITTKLINKTKDNCLVLPASALGNLKIRNRRAGDIVKIPQVGKKKLKDFFSDLKIAQMLRDEIPLVEYQNQIVWVVGYRKFISDFADNTGKSEYIIIEYIQ